MINKFKSSTRKILLPAVARRRLASEKKNSSAYRAVARSGLFNARHYLSSLPLGTSYPVDPLEHYLSDGARAGGTPNPWFDPKFYLSTHEDVAAANVDPLVHFAEHGWRELRRTSSTKYDIVWHWLMANKDSSELVNPMVQHCAEYATDRSSVKVREAKALATHEASQLVLAYRSVLSRHDLAEGALRVIGEYAVKNNLWASAEEVYHALILKRPDILDYRLSLVTAAEKQGRIWQMAEVLAGSIKVNPSDASLHVRLGEAYERMNRFTDAAAAFHKAAQISQNDAVIHYRYGYALEKSGDALGARSAYKEAILRDTTLKSASFGIGAFHQKRELYVDAVAAYSEVAALRPQDPDIWFKLGFAQDRCYDWVKAQHSYSVGLSLNFERPYWHYRLGFVLERQGKWQEAAGAYRTAADMDTQHRPYWYYRCGYVSELSGDTLGACAAYLLMEKDEWQAHTANRADFYDKWFTPRPSPEQANLLPVHRNIERATEAYVNVVATKSVGEAISHRAIQVYSAAQRLESRGQLLSATKLYQQAIDRSPRHAPSWYRSLGKAFTSLGRYQEACEAFRNSRILKRAYGIDLSEFEKNATAKAMAEYIEYFDNYPIKTKHVLYDSYLGSSIGCNPYAIFKEILDQEYFKDWVHIWVVNDRTYIPAHISDKKNVIFVERNSDAFRRYLATSEYLISNVTFPHWFIRRDGQKYLNTWHGTPLKALGRDVKKEFMTHGNVTRNFLHATHLISPNRHTTEVMLKSYDIEGIHTGKIAETGYPRIDQISAAKEADRRQLLEQLGLDSRKKVVLYAPTWRGVQGNPQTDTDRVISDIKSLASDEYQLVFRGHHMMESALKGLDIAVTVAPQSIDGCAILSITDLLITDYSSIFFDFLPTEKPIIYYAYDYTEYESQQGFYFQLSELPGKICKSIDEVRAACTESLTAISTDHLKYREAITRFCSLEDGNSTQRTVDFFFHNSDRHVVEHRSNTSKSIIMYNGMFPINGVTSSYLSLMRSLEEEDVVITTLFDQAKINSDPVRVENFATMPRKVKGLVQVGEMPRDPEEAWIFAQLGTPKVPASQEMSEINFKAHQREYRRLVGGARYDAFVNFEGYQTAVCHIGAAAPRDVRKAIYLHNDMIGERDVRLPHLEKIFRLYDCYDSLVSVSKAICDVNQEGLGRAYNLSPSKFVYCENTIDPRRVETLAQEDLDGDLSPWFGSGATFLCLARMSPEKGQAKLLRAFAAVLSRKPDAKLVLLGDGPLKQDLAQLAQQLGIGGSVKLASARLNPFPALKATDCLVLSSDHEGQGLVLLEAMILGKPIIATDIVTSRDVLKGTFGTLVENSEAGLRDGMLKFLDDGGRPYIFDAARYQADAVRSFRTIVLGEGAA